MRLSAHRVAQAMILGAAIALRFSALTQLPWRIDGDAAVFSYDGVNVLNAGGALFGTGWEGHSNVWLSVVGVATKLFSDPLFAIRFLSAVGGVAGVIATYAAATRLSRSSTLGLFAAALLAISPFHLVFSRNGMELTWSAFFLAATLALLCNNKLRDWSAAGVMTAASLYVAQSSRAIPIIVLVFLLLRLIHTDAIPRKRYIIQGVFWLTTTMLLYAPQLWYYIHEPASFGARIARVSLFEPQIWHESLQLHQSLTGLLTYQLQHAFLPFFISFTDTTKLWYFQLPYLNPLPLALYCIGLLTLAYRYRSFNSQLVAAIHIIILSASAATTLPPMSSRYVILFPIVAYGIAQGCITCLKILNHVRIHTLIRYALGMLGVSIGICIVVSEIVSYIHHDTQLIFQHDPTTQKNTVITRYVREHPSIRIVYTPHPERIATMVTAYSAADVKDIQEFALDTPPAPAVALFFDTEDVALLRTYSTPTTPATALYTPEDVLVGYLIQHVSPP